MIEVQGGRDLIYFVHPCIPTSLKPETSIWNIVGDSQYIAIEKMNEWNEKYHHDTEMLRGKDIPKSWGGNYYALNIHYDS